MVQKLEDVKIEVTIDRERLRRELDQAEQEEGRSRDEREREDRRRREDEERREGRPGAPGRGRGRGRFPSIPTSAAGIGQIVEQGISRGAGALAAAPVAAIPVIGTAAAPIVQAAVSTAILPALRFGEPAGRAVLNELLPEIERRFPFGGRQISEAVRRAFDATIQPLSQRLNQLEAGLRAIDQTFERSVQAMRAVAISGREFDEAFAGRVVSTELRYNLIEENRARFGQRLARQRIIETLLKSGLNRIAR